MEFKFPPTPINIVQQAAFELSPQKKLSSKQGAILKLPTWLARMRFGLIDENISSLPAMARAAEVRPAISTRHLPRRI